MSKKRNQAILAWRNTEVDIQSQVLCRDGLRLCTADTRKYAQALTLWGLLLTDLDLVDGHSARRLVRRISRLDVLTVARCLKSCDELLLENFRDAHNHVPLERFKHALSDVPPLYHVFLPVVSDHLRMASTASFRALHQSFAFLSHLSLDGIPNDDDVAAWIENNNRLANADIDFSIVDMARPIVTDWLAGISIPSVGKHGSGTVQEWPAWWTHRKIYSCDKINDPTSMLYHGYSTGMHAALRQAGIQEPERYIPSDFFPNPRHEERCANSRLISVPKNALKRRIIAPETLSQQFFQQQLMIGIYNHIDHKMPWIPIRDQGVNQDLAREGSISGYYATIDLSAASDSVRTDLVQSMFRETSILPAMEACRSRRTIVEEDGREYTLPMSMYATMGSAICFPLECIVFSALCAVTARLVGHRLKFSVYGDDIIFPSKYAPELIRVLTACGFIVNNDKSFTSPDPLLFRESCGGEYLRGDDVTPLRISRRLRPLENKRKQPAAFSAYIELANAALDRGFLGLRSYVISQLLSSPPYPIFGEGEGFLHTVGPATNYRLRQRWNGDYQRHECRGAVIVTKPAKISMTRDLQHRIDTGLYDTCRLEDWERTRELEEFLEHRGVPEIPSVHECCPAPSNLTTKERWKSPLY